MKILLIGNFLGPTWDGSISDEEHIAEALEELGHQVIRKQRGHPGWPPGNYDFTLVAQWDQYGLSLDNVPKPLVYWAFDYQADGQEWHEILVKQSDLYLSKRIADSKYPNWQWLSQDFAPKFLDKWKEPISVEMYEQAPLDRDIDVLFTGSYLPWATERNETLKAVDDKFNLTIHSVNEWPGFKNQLGPLMDMELPRLYSRAKVILSIDHTLEAGYWSDRNAQIMACGRRPLFRYVPLSESTFHNNVDYFYNVQDCLEQIQYILDGLRPAVLEDVSYNAAGELKVIQRVADLLTIVKGIL